MALISKRVYGHCNVPAPKRQAVAAPAPASAPAPAPAPAPIKPTFEGMQQTVRDYMSAEDASLQDAFKLALSFNSAKLLIWFIHEIIEPCTVRFQQAADFLGRHNAISKIVESEIPREDLPGVFVVLVHFFVTHMKHVGHADWILGYLATGTMFDSCPELAGEIMHAVVEAKVVPPETINQGTFFPFPVDADIDDNRRMCHMPAVMVALRAHLLPFTSVGHAASLAILNGRWDIAEQVLKAREEYAMSRTENDGEGIHCLYLPYMHRALANDRGFPEKLAEFLAEFSDVRVDSSDNTIKWLYRYACLFEHRMKFAAFVGCEMLEFIHAQEHQVPFTNRITVQIMEQVLGTDLPLHIYAWLASLVPTNILNMQTTLGRGMFSNVNISIQEHLHNLVKAHGLGIRSLEFMEHMYAEYNVLPSKWEIPDRTYFPEAFTDEAWAWLEDKGVIPRASEDGTMERK